MMAQESTRKALRSLPSTLVFLATILLFVAERLIAPGNLRAPILVVAGAAFAAGLVLRLLWRREAPEAAKRLTLAQVTCYAGLLIGAALYGLHLHFEAADNERVSVIALLASLVVFLTHLSVLIAVELAAARMREAGFVEMLRVRQAAATAATVALALSGLGFLNYAAKEKDIRKDLSYAAPITPSQATRSLIEASERKVEVYLFFEKGSPVLTELGDYFDALEGVGVEVHVLDQALDPDLAQDLKVSRNGTVALRSGERSETWYVGTTRDAARRKLSKLDEEIRTRLAKLTRDEKTIYFTVGHGEREDKRAGSGERDGADIFGKIARALNTKVKHLGVAEGLASRVPDDADVVVVHGPTSDFLPEEAEAMKAYVERGGALLLLLDPGVEHGLEPVLEMLGLKAAGVEVANDREFVRMSHTAADHAFLFSTSFASHRAVRALNEAPGRVALLFFGAGKLERAGDGKAKVTFIARSRAGTFEDKDGDRVFDEGEETRGVVDLAAAASRMFGADKEARAVVAADSGVLSDKLLRNEANAVFAYEALLWLLRDDKTSGAIDRDDDVPIRHTREEDALWFYGTTFAAPLLVLGGGLLFIRAKRRRRAA